MIEVRGVLPTEREQRPVQKGWGAVHWLSIAPLLASFAVVIAAWFFLAPYGVRMPEHVFWLFFLASFIVWWIATSLASHLIAWIARRAPIGQAASDWIVSEEGLSTSGPLYATRVSWRGVRDVREEADRFVFLVTPYTNFVLPRRVLSDEQAAVLRTLLAEVKSSGRLGVGVD